MGLFKVFAVLINIIVLATADVPSLQGIQGQRTGRVAFFGVRATRPKLQSELEAEIVPVEQQPLEQRPPTFLRTLQLPAQHTNQPFRPVGQSVVFQEGFAENNRPISPQLNQNRPWEVFLDADLPTQRPNQPYKPPFAPPANQPTSLEAHSSSAAQDATEKPGWFSFFQAFKPFKPQEVSQTPSQELVAPLAPSFVQPNNPTTPSRPWTSQQLSASLPQQFTTPSRPWNSQQQFNLWNGFFNSATTSSQSSEKDEKQPEGYDYPKPEKPFEEASPEFPESTPEIITAPPDVEVEKLVAPYQQLGLPRPTLIHGIIFVHPGQLEAGQNSRQKVVVYRVPPGFSFDRTPRTIFPETLF